MSAPTAPLRTSLVCLPIVAALSLVGCSSGDSTTSTETSKDKTGDSTSSASEAAVADGALSVSNCGREVSLDKPAQKILTVHPAMTEMVIAAGGKDQLIGQMWTQAGFPTGEFSDAVSGVKEVSKALASREKVAELKPDLIVSSGDFWFDGERLDKIEDLEKSGIAVFINSSACGDTGKATVADAFDDLKALGTLTGHADTAKETADKYKKKLEEATVSGEAKPAALIQLYQGDSYAYDGGIYSDVLKHAGLSNTFKGQLPEGKRFGKVSAEAVLKANPEVLLVNYAKPEEKDKNVDEAKKSFAGVKAVDGDKVLPTSELGFVGGIGSVRAVEDIASAVSGS